MSLTLYFDFVPKKQYIIIHPWPIHEKLNFSKFPSAIFVIFLMHGIEMNPETVLTIIVYMTLSPKWHYLPSDTISQVTLSPKWLYLPTDTISQMTLSPKWHYLPTDTNSQVTLSPKWHYLPTDTISQLTQCPNWQYLPSDTISQLTTSQYAEIPVFAPNTYYNEMDFLDCAATCVTIKYDCTQS